MKVLFIGVLGLAIGLALDADGVTEEPGKRLIVVEPQREEQPAGEEASAQDETAQEQATDPAAQADADEPQPSSDATERAGGAGAKRKTESVRLVDPTLKDLMQKISYLWGRSIGERVKGEDLEIDRDMFFQGLTDVLDNQESLLSAEEVKEANIAFERMMKNKKAERMKSLTAKNQLEGSAFLAENRRKKGVKTLESGLQYEVLKRGKGRSPRRADAVIVHYKGRLLDGTEFDSSYQRGQPVSLQMSEVIPGWQEALQLMRAGDKWRLVIPPDLAYGPQGAGDSIGPYATLIFEVELLDIQQGQPPGVGVPQ